MTDFEVKEGYFGQKVSVPKAAPARGKKRGKVEVPCPILTYFLLLLLLFLGMALGA
jgi:hypothetical protein